MTQGPYGTEPYPQQPAAQQTGWQPPVPGSPQAAYQPAAPAYPAPAPAYPASYPPPAPGYPLQPGGFGTAPRNGLGTAALVLGIIGVVLCWIPVTGWALGILAIIFGGVGMGRAKSGEATNKSAAVAGLILGAVALAIWVIVLVYVIVALGSATLYFS